MASLVNPLFAGHNPLSQPKIEIPSNKIIEINSLQDIESYLTAFDPESFVIASNIHNTLITYDDPLLRSGVNKLIDDLVCEKIKREIKDGSIKETEKEKYSKLYKEKYMSIILLEAKYQLTEQTETYSSASIINDLAKKFFVIGFTESKTGPFGSIPNAEVWRTDLLKRFGITFPAVKNIETTKRFSDPSMKQNYAIYNEGILFVGNKKEKTKTFVEFLKQTKPSVKQIVIIDNRKENIEILQQELKEEGISVLGFVYHYKNDTPIDLEKAAIQKQTLLEKSKWLS